MTIPVFCPKCGKVIDTIGPETFNFKKMRDLQSFIDITGLGEDSSSGECNHPPDIIIDAPAAFGLVVRHKVINSLTGKVLSDSYQYVGPASKFWIYVAMALTGQTSLYMPDKGWIFLIRGRLHKGWT